MVDVTGDYAELTGQGISGGPDGKSFCFAARRRDRHLVEGLLYKGEHLPVRDTAELLGTEMPMEEARGKETKKTKERVKKILKRAGRLARLPLGSTDKEALATGGVMPAGTYAAGISGRIPGRKMVSMRRQIMKGLFNGLCGSHGCVEVAFTTMTKAHAADPGQAFDYEALRLLRRLTTQNQRVRAALRRTWEATRRGGREGPPRERQADRSQDRMGVGDVRPAADG